MANNEQIEFSALNGRMKISLIKVNEDSFGRKIEPIDAMMIKSGQFTMTINESELWALNLIWNRRAA